MLVGEQPGDKEDLAGKPFVGPAGELLTLLAVQGPATGVTTTGLRYPLHDEALTPGSTRGARASHDRAPRASRRTGPW